MEDRKTGTEPRIGSRIGFPCRLAFQNEAFAKTKYDASSAVGFYDSRLIRSGMICLEPGRHNELGMAESEVPSYIQAWLQGFREKHGRSVHVLHIGNIANNGYINAKLLKSAGLDCDVICYDYYHIMGCPEWEDADFEGQVGDDMYPNWRKVNLNGFIRPRWFAQGLQNLCIRYLIAFREGRRLQSLVWWRMMEVNRWALSRGIGLGLKESMGRAWRLRHLALRSRKELSLHLANHGLKLHSKGSKRLDLKDRTHRSGTQSLVFEDRIKELVKDFDQRFRERSDKLSVEDFKEYRRDIELWSRLFQHYDIIQAYSTDPILPLLAGNKYFAFEHGTLRDIPFQGTSQGRLASLSYSHAWHTFVTNADCVDNARTLTGDRFTFINHPFEEDHGLNIKGSEALRRELQVKLSAEFLVFFPSRQDWVPGTGYADKANDLLLRSFGRLTKEGFKVGLVCCHWGANVKESMELLRSYGCSDRVLWSQPMGSIQFERTAKACHLTADQFKLGSFGGVMFKAMAVGSPICTYLDEPRMLVHYQEVPPVINCRTEEEICLRLRDAFKDPASLERLGVSGRNWIRKHHNSRDTVVKQLERYREFLSSTVDVSRRKRQRVEGGLSPSIC